MFPASILSAGRVRRGYLLPVVISALVALSGCRGTAAGGGKTPGADTQPADQPRALTVFAAASLTPAFQALQASFEQENSGWTVRFNFGASSALRTQIEQGAPADVFAAADHAQMRPLAEVGLVRTPVAFARNRLVLVTPGTNPGDVTSPKDLARPGLRVVTTAPAVPIGQYTQQVLEKLSGHPAYPSDFAERVERNVASREANVRAVLAKVELGEADAAVVYESDAKSAPGVKVFPIPEGANVLAEYPIAVVATSPHGPGAEAFIRLVRSPEGHAVLKQHGFR